MKKFFLLAALTFVVDGTINAQVTAMTEGEVQQVIDREKELSKTRLATPSWVFQPIKPMTEEAGWTLIHTNSHTWEDGDVWTWKHYESEDQAMRTVTAKNGDFMTIFEREDGNYEAFQINGRARPFGGFRITMEDGSVLEVIAGKNNDDQRNRPFRYTFTNGNIIFGHFKELSIFFVTAELFYSEDSRKKLIKDIFDKTYVEDACIILVEDRSGCYKLTKRVFEKENKLWTIPDNGWPLAIMQRANGELFYANNTDTITSIENGVVSYANGDQLKYEEVMLGRVNPFGEMEYMKKVTGTIHRNGGVLKISTINGKTRCRLTLPNGDFFTGVFKEMEHLMRFDNFYDQTLQYRSLTPYNGTWNRGGQIDEIVKGMGKADYEKAEAAKKAKENAATKAAYEKLCAQYGKKYVDAAYEEKIILGMPEKLLLLAFKTNVISESEYSKHYRVYGYNFNGVEHAMVMDLRHVWVSGGRVTDITNW